MHFLITGHTGFKGSWLSSMLKLQGHLVSGISLNPDGKCLFSDANLHEIFEHDVRMDIRNRKEIRYIVHDIAPDVVIHLAAQPLVRESYVNPIETYETNLMGTLNVLEATRELKNLKAILVITTDKVYRNINVLRGYVESDELGGDDPYSASKAVADIATQSWFKCFGNAPLAIARAGNVIGGGDWAKDRLIPDLVRSYSRSLEPEIRFPTSIRPWQHVLDCLNGYCLLIDKMISSSVTGEWNFGPDNRQQRTVLDVVNTFADSWGYKGSQKFIDRSKAEHFQESNLLLLDSSKARRFLGWSDKLDFAKTIDWTVSWYQKAISESAREITELQIREFGKI